MARARTILAGLAVVLGACMARPEGPGSPAPRKPPPILVLHDWYGTSPVASPSYIREHAEYLDTLPFDGIVAYVRTPDLTINVSAAVLDRRPLDPGDVALAMAPLRGLSMANLTENFAAVVGGNPPDFLDDWSVTARNFAVLAAEARRAGLRGLYIDNETYHAPWTDYPRGVRDPKVPQVRYEELARERGREVMGAIVREFPDVVVVFLHGPYLSDPRAPAPLFPAWQSANELLGPFFAGFVEGAGDRATVVDGGELYHLRGEWEFREAAEWRRRVQPSEEADSRVIPKGLREAWRRRVRVGFGITDRAFRWRAMDPQVLEGAVASALRNSDGVVWLYVEGPSFLKPPEQGGASRTWIEAVRRGRRGVAGKVQMN